ncbi:lysylphosphatidylglycerol synthase domain-containing protein [Cellulomonas sp. GbtcB1]|uniref:lysylphosphatidylglycerol synthase domain-containing protein n=1 Tax=Cellulomonas sp. GbtcB1 TaxID=2824746 RepID=UPI001C30D9BB|nr:lysylphosphatidylglycerol synthase domain-containing protein [Cellulomonas sp. GbtcB1]
MPDTEPQTTTPAAATPRARWRAVLKWAALGLVVVFAAVFVAQEWSGFVAGLRRLDLPSVAGAVVAILAGLCCAMLSWRAVLAGVGSRLPHLAAARVYFLGQLGKYVPGSVWPIVAQAELSKEYGVPRARAGLASLTQMLVGLVVGVCVAGVTLALSSPDAFASYWWLVLVAVAGVVVLLPPVFNRLVTLALRVTRREPAGAIGGRAVLTSALWCLGMWAAFGTHLWLLARSVGAPSEGLFLLTTGGYALAWVVGFVIVFLPAGAGAREAALVLALAPALPREDALVLAVVSRFLMLAGDGVSAGAAILAEKAHARRTAVSASGRTGSA